MSSTAALNFDLEIEKLFKSIAENENIADYKIEKESGSMKGFGYLGVITPIQLVGYDKSGNKKVLHLIVKSASKSNELRDSVPISYVFHREIYVYNEVFPEFRKFQSERGLKNQSLQFAKCYKACTIDKSETLILENLKSTSHKLWDRRFPMDEEHVSFVLKEYARFHAVSYAMKDQKPELFEKLTSSLQDVILKFLENPNFVDMFKKHNQKALDTLDPVKDAEIYNVFKPFTEYSIEKLFKEVVVTKQPFSVFLHGDCWTNNMMFKYNENSSKPTHLCLIDFQISRLGPPPLDLTYYFYSCASRQIIDDLHRYQKIYHDSLSSHLRALGSNPEEIYPFSVFQQQWKVSAKYGLIFALILIHIMLSEEDEVVDLSDVADSGSNVMNAFDYEIASKQEYDERAKHLVTHCVKNGFL